MEGVALTKILAILLCDHTRRGPGIQVRKRTSGTNGLVPLNTLNNTPQLTQLVG